jgi:hypothetical protein
VPLQERCAWCSHKHGGNQSCRNWIGLMNQLVASSVLIQHRFGGQAHVQVCCAHTHAHCSACAQQEHSS